MYYIDIELASQVRQKALKLFLYFLKKTPDKEYLVQNSDISRYYDNNQQYTHFSHIQRRIVSPYLLELKQIFGFELQFEKVEPQQIKFTYNFDRKKLLKS